MSGFRRNTREDAEAAESQSLANEAIISTGTRGRTITEDPDPYRTALEVDRDRILFSKAFRRLRHKTQVFMNPEGDHYVTRLTHTLKVTQIGRSIARRLSLNEALTEAACLGHDVGHSPFGHSGEDALSEFVDGEWLHANQSARIFEVLEPANLTWEVLDAIRAHTWKIPVPPSTPEGAIVRFADRIAYLAHDAEDAIRADILTETDFPATGLGRFGKPRPALDRLDARCRCRGVPSERARSEWTRLRCSQCTKYVTSCSRRVYLRPEMEPQRRRAQQIVRELVEYFLTHPSEIPTTYLHEAADPVTQVVDYVAGMTDRFAVRTHDDIFRPRLFD